MGRRRELPPRNERLRRELVSMRKQSSAAATRRTPPSTRAAAEPALKFKLMIAYDGTAYQGWQVQKIGTGIQEKMEEALGHLFPSKPRLHGSSRTDTGVHALGMVAHFEISRVECSMPARKLCLALNAWLPADVRVLSCARAGKDFHARFSAIRKQYRYFVWNAPAMNPLLRHTAWHVPRRLEIELMRRAAARLIGKHDFRSFTANPGYERESTVRHLTRCEIKRSGSLLTFIIEGDGFLYKMCRGIVGTLVQVGLGKFPVNEIPAILRSKDRRVAGMTAPAQGLILWRVYYPRTSMRPKANKRPH